jgi:hypothetical protein
VHAEECVADQLGMGDTATTLADALARFMTYVEHEPR